MTPDQRRLERHAADSAIVRLWESLVPLTSINSFLQTGAHPDDETSRLLARLAKGDGVRVGYACAVRGEGGQNAIGTEARNELGVLRTREMEGAAATLGMTLYWLNEEFDGAIFDFGLSKSADEAFRHWGRERTLERLVRAIRTFRPDVMAPTFLDVPGQHGHHRAVTVATEEAFHLAADPAAFPDHLHDGLLPWQVKKLYLPAWSGAGAAYDDTEPPPNATLTVPVGGFDSVLGATYAQIAQWSRASHRSQGMGRWVAEGAESVPLHRLACAIDAPADERGLFDGLPTTLAALADEVAAPDVATPLRAAQQAIAVALTLFPDGRSVAAAVHTALAAVRAAADALTESGASGPSGDAAIDIAHLLAIKERQLCHASRCACLLVTRLQADRPVVCPGDTVGLTLTVYRGGAVDLDAVSLDLAVPRGWTVERDGPAATALDQGATLAARFRVTVPVDADEVHAYTFATDPLAPGGPASGRVGYAVDGVAVEVGVATEEPLAVLPAVAASAEPAAAAYNLARGGPLTIAATATNHGTAGVDARLALTPPVGWRVVPSDASPHLPPAASDGATFTVTPPDYLAPGRHVLPVTIDGVAARSVRTIAHGHLRTAHVVTPATVTVQAMTVALPPALKVGYVDGGSDRVHVGLRQIGVDVELLDAEALARGDLGRYDTIVVGIFAYRTRPDLLAANERIKDFVARGGNLVTQYHRPWDAWDPETVPPHYLKIGQPSLRWRVTDQAAAVTHLVPDHPLLTHPNEIGADDWADWVKERGLYFAADWAPDYTALLAMADPGEAPLKGALLTARYGRGRHTHTSLILHYQMAFLVPGAFRMMANLITSPERG
ncbi:MAG: NEW3 domain-containing protein [Alphaproteobacteria bacterium]